MDDERARSRRRPAPACPGRSDSSSWTSTGIVPAGSGVRTGSGQSLQRARRFASRVHINAVEVRGLQRLPGAGIGLARSAACYTRPELTEPGGQAKWVRIPRGAATVSGEPHPRAGNAGCHCCAETTRSVREGEWEGWDGRDDPQARIPGAGRSLSHRRETRREGVAMFFRSARALLFAASRHCLLILAPQRAARRRRRSPAGSSTRTAARCPAPGSSSPARAAATASAETDGDGRFTLDAPARAAPPSASRSTASAPSR